MIDDAAPADPDSPPPVEPAAPADSDSQPADQSAAPTASSQATADVAAPEETAPPPAATDAPAGERPAGQMSGESGSQQKLNADANGLYPHSRLGGNPKRPLAVGGFSSPHHDGVNFALGDGSVRFIADGVTAGLMGRLANRADGKTIDAREW